MIDKVSIQCTSFSFNINRCFTLKKHTLSFENKIVKNKISKLIWQIESGDKHDQGDTATKLRSKCINGTHFIVQKRFFFF